MSGLPAVPRYRDLIGATPMVDITALAELQPGMAGKVKVFGKCEFMNPGFSMKDRIMKQIFDDAEAAGLLQSGGTVVAASSGNTGAAAAMLGAIRGYKVVIITNSKCSKEKQDAIKAYGAELVVVATGVDYMAEANRLADEHGWFDVNQYDNPANSKAYELTMAPEIWQATSGKITHFVAGGSTGGTITGCARYFRRANPGGVQAILADPIGSIFAEFHRSGEVVETGKKFLVEGVGKENIPGVIDFNVIDSVVPTTDAEAFAACHKLAMTEGLLVGGSAGMNAAAALKLAGEQTEPAVIVTVLCDTGIKYLSKVFNPEWLEENNMPPIAKL